MKQSSTINAPITKAPLGLRISPIEMVLLKNINPGQN
jgi:hypothetical protein